MKGCTMEGAIECSDPTCSGSSCAGAACSSSGCDDTDALYAARRRRTHERPPRRTRRAPSPDTCDDLAPVAVAVAAEVHDYPSSESGIAADLAPRGPRHYEERALSIEERCAKDLDEILPARLAGVALSRSEEHRRTPRWNRDNIAATMERFEPTDYCYAYYEPGAARRHNLSVPSAARVKARRQHTQHASEERARHAFITRYGTEENIYEEITDGARGRCPKHGAATSGMIAGASAGPGAYRHRQSLVSLDQSVVEEEVRRVETRHKRILGELNLSVEAMLMPECESPELERAEDRDGLEELLRVGPTDELLSPASCPPPADLDSGFSGSSSGASYVGSLRCKPGGRACTPLGSNLNLPAVVYGTRGVGAGVRILDATCARRAAADALSAHSAHSPHSPRSSSCGDSAKGSGFWSKKAWKKIPGFSSSNSINKAGLSGLLVRYTFRRKSSGPAPPPKHSRTSHDAARAACETCLSQRC